MYKNEKARILHLLKIGRYIRLADGRCADEFVNIEILNELIKTGQAVIFKNAGFNFVKMGEIK